MSTTTRIARNTLALYFRQILIMLVSLYTVRVVLAALGAEDYGIYQVVAGVVTMLQFVSWSMAAASQRYLSFALGRGDFEQLKRVFSLNLAIYVLVSGVILLLAETGGLWFADNILVIPAARKRAALWVYQVSVVSILCGMLAAPYVSLLIAHEDMNIYAGISIFEAALKMGMVFMLNFIKADKLIVYGILMSVVTMVNTIVYIAICRVKYRECSFVPCWNKKMFKEISGYTGWCLVGSLSGVAKNQGINILLNQMLNPVVVASRGIASMVNNAVSSFAQNFNTAMGPQIIKSYAVGEKEYMVSIILRGMAGSYFLMYVLTLPLILEMPFVLALWLKEVPEYAVVFTSLTLIDVLIESLTYSVSTAIQATGNIKSFQTVVGGLRIMNLPLSWAALSLGAHVYAVMLISIGVTCLAFIVRLIIIKRLLDFPVILLIKKAVVPMVMISALSAALSFAVFSLMTSSLIRLCLVSVINLSVVTALAFFTLLNSHERQMIKNMITNLRVNRSGNREK
jgi:O-antigen/teichoic acid export membrane protein